jgi:CxxC motif-containing protein
VITSTVKIEGGLHRRLPVKTNGAILKKDIFEAMKLLDGLTVTSPVKCGDILVKNVLGSGVDFVASRDM